MPLTQALIDDFDDNTTDTTKWSSTSNGAGNTLNETGGALVITLGGTSGSYSYYDQTAASYDFTNSYVQVNAKTVPIDAAVNTQMFIKVYNNATNYFTIGKIGANLLMQSQTGGVDSNTTIAYQPGQMDWWRIRNEGGNILWETSVNGRSWSIERTLATPFAITTVGIQVGAGSFAADSAPGTATFDSFNLVLSPFMLPNDIRPYPFTPGFAR